MQHQPSVLFYLGLNSHVRCVALSLYAQRARMGITYHPKLAIVTSAVRQFIGFLFTRPLRLAGEGEDVGSDAVCFFKAADQRGEFFAQVLGLFVGAVEV